MKSLPIQLEDSVLRKVFKRLHYPRFCRIIKALEDSQVDYDA